MTLQKWAVRPGGVSPLEEIDDVPHHLLCSPVRLQEIGISLPNNQHCNLPIQKDVLPYALC